MPGAHTCPDTFRMRFRGASIWLIANGQSRLRPRRFMSVWPPVYFRSIVPQHPPIRGDFHTIAEPAADFAWPAAIKQSARCACATSSVAPRLAPWSCLAVRSVARGAGLPQVPR
jgi:hypothetical protein